jgi:hypothetical protein
MDKIYLNASDVSAAIGLNRWKSQKQVLEKYRNPKNAKITEYEQISSIIDKVAVKLNDKELSEKYQQVKNDPEKLAALSEKVVEKLSENVIGGENVNQRTEMYQEIQELVGEEIYTKLETNLTSKVNTTIGTQDEEKIIENVETRNKVSVSQRNSRMYYTSFYYDNFTVKIGGKIDGFDEENNTLIEVKRRMNRFLGMPDYEKVQCEIYMKMKGTNKCILTEMFDGESRDHYYESDEILVNKIRDGLGSYANVAINDN